MTPKKLIIVILLSTVYFLLSIQLSFAPVSDDVSPEEAIRAIEMQREEAREAERIKEEQAQEAELDVQETKKVIPKTAVQKKQNNQSINFWLVTLGIVVLGLFILSRIKSDKAK